MPVQPNEENFTEYLDLSLRNYGDRCAEISQKSGVEAKGELNFSAALDVLNRDSNLHFDQTDKQLFSLIFTALGMNAKRFKGDIHLHPEFGENSATHSIQCVVLADSVFEAARLEPSLESAKLQHEIRLGLLLHDIGESFGEFTSLGQRAAKGTEEASGDIERDIFRYIFKLAAHAVETGNSAGFHEIVGRITTEAQVSENGDEAAIVLSKLMATEPVPYISPELTARLDNFLNLYDAAEMKKGEDFYGYAIKAIEHNQGTRHLLRFMENGTGDKSGFLDTISAGLERSGQLPFDTATSYRAKRNNHYLEGEIGDLFAHAKTPAELQLAKAIRDRAYETAIQCIQCYRPVIDRFPANADSNGEKSVDYRSSDPDPQVRHAVWKAAMKEGGQMACRDLFHNERLAHGAQNPKDPLGNRRLFNVETRNRLVALYRHAIKRDYIPKPKEVLASLNELPPQLAPLFPEREASRGR